MNQEKPTRGVLLEDLTWQEAEAALTAEAVVVIPLGAAAKEHGPHLKLKNDFLLAEYFKARVLAERQVVIAPTVAYHFYPAFVEYPGSITLSLPTARDIVLDICRSLSQFGPRRFYVLNTGISTMRALAPAKEILSGEGITLSYTDLARIEGDFVKRISEQKGGSHADEVETSMMLYIAPETVNMENALCDYDEKGEGPLTRIEGGAGTYSPSGIWGDATLATREKGKAIVEHMVAGILRDIDELVMNRPHASC